MGNREHDPLDTRAQEQQAEQAEKRKQLKRLQSDEDFRWLMLEARGRRFMWDLLAATGVFRNPFAGQRELTDFRCGEMNVGQQQVARIHELCPEQYHEMVKEQQEK